MGYAISVHGMTVGRLGTGFTLIYSHIPSVLDALHKELYFLSSSKHIIHICFINPLTILQSKERTYIFMPHTWMGTLQMRGGEPFMISAGPGFESSIVIDWPPDLEHV